MKREHTPEQGSLPSHRIRDERLWACISNHELQSLDTRTHQDKQATLTGGTANFFRMPDFCRVCVSVLISTKFVVLFSQKRYSEVDYCWNTGKG